MKGAPEPADPFVLGKAKKDQPAAPAEKWVPHPTNRDIEINVSAPGEHKPMRTKPPVLAGFRASATPVVHEE